MNGPEHYREAERLLKDCTHAGGGVYADTAEPLAAAAAHATLALTAATVLAAKAGITAAAAEMSQWDTVTGAAKRGRS
jgi:hypothetical protein